MPTPADYLAFLRHKGVKLWFDNGELRYQARKGSLSADELAELRRMRAEIIAELSQSANPEPSNPRQAGANAGRRAPLSFQQQWLLTMIQDHSHWKPTLTFTLHLTGELDISALEKAFRSVLSRHEGLRTRLVAMDGVPEQRIEESARFQLGFSKIREASDGETENATLSLIQEIESRALDPAVAPMMMAELLQISPQNHFLILVIHRLATDCLGVIQVLRGLWSSYRKVVSASGSGFEEETAQYGDYAIWQHATDAVWRGKHAAYWTERLMGAERIRWPIEDCMPSAATDSQTHLASLESSLGETLSAKLRELARQRQTLPALVVLAVYAASVSTLCKQEDFILPFLIAGRTSENESVVGYFSYIVYLRVKCSGTESFADLLKQLTHEYYRAATFRQDFGRNVAQRPELLGGTLCQWLSWHPSEVAGLGLDDLTRPLGITLQRVRCQNLEEFTNTPPSTVDIEMTFFDAKGEIGAFATWQSDLLAQDFAPRLMQRIRSVAERITDDPLCPVFS